MGKPDSKGTSGVRSRAISRESAHEAQNAADAQRAADRRDQLYLTLTSPLRMRLREADRGRQPISLNGPFLP